MVTILDHFRVVKQALLEGRANVGEDPESVWAEAYASLRVAVVTLYDEKTWESL